MIRTMLAAAAVLAATATVALAADLPSKTAEPEFEPPPPIPVFSWTGFTAGVHSGYGFGRDTATLRSRIGGASGGAILHGVTGGVHFGYNYAVPTVIGQNALVVGAEGDVDGADYQRTGSPFRSVLGGTTMSVRSDIKGSLRGRLGVGVNRYLFYATGGAAFANFDTRYNGSGTFGAFAFDSRQRVKTGYTVGGGVEYAFMNYLTVRAEYRYSDYGTFVDTLGTASPGLNASVVHRDTDNRLQAGLSYKFESIVPSPVSAGY